jgi:hypothetical protein
LSGVLGNRNLPTTDNNSCNNHNDSLNVAYARLSVGNDSCNNHNDSLSVGNDSLNFAYDSLSVGNDSLNRGKYTLCIPGETTERSLTLLFFSLNSMAADDETGEKPKIA